jgi:intracellular sulfur oxidation DsrE/DsrF family protein
MKNALIGLAVALGLAGCATMEAGPHAAPANETRIAFDVTNGNPTAVTVILNTIELTRKQLIEKGQSPKIVVGFRGDASYYTTTNLAAVKEADRADALKIRSIIRELRKAEGVVAMEQCNVPLAGRKLKPEDVMPEVKVVPNGWIGLVGYQKQGYAYIAP